jgi:hypothetical protein
LLSPAQISQLISQLQALFLQRVQVLVIKHAGPFHAVDLFV